MTAQRIKCGRSSQESLCRGLEGFQAGFAFARGALPADPDHAAAHGAEGLIVQNDLDDLAALEMEAAAQPEAALGRIEYQTRDAFLSIDDEAGAGFGDSALRETAFGNRQAGHRAPPVMDVTGN